VQEACDEDANLAALFVPVEDMARARVNIKRSHTPMGKAYAAVAKGLNNGV